MGVAIAIAFAMVASSAATAEAAPKWPLSDTEKPTAALPVEASAKAAKTAVLGVASVNMVVSCGGIALEKAQLTEGGAGTGTLAFSNCVSKTPGGSVLNACKPREGAESGVVRSKPLKAQVVSHEGASLVRLEPQTGTTLATIYFGEECAVSEEFVLTGSFYAKESNGELEVLKETHSFEEGPLTSMKVGVNKATIEGSATMSLAGGHVGRWWSGSAT